MREPCYIEAITLDMFCRRWQFIVKDIIDVFAYGVAYLLVMCRF